jgi:predicted component of type VI protein secretion system
LQKYTQSAINDLIFGVCAAFSNISAISWRPVLEMEEAGVLGENHRPWGSN